MPDLVEHCTGGDEIGDAGHLLELIYRRPAWHADAACREHPEINFFPALGESVAPALAVCAGCLVRTECREFAIGQGSVLPGVWGGTTVRSRRKLARSPLEELPATLVAGRARGACACCGRLVTGIGADRLRAGYCSACTAAWRRWLASGKPDDREAFTASRRR